MPVLNSGSNDDQRPGFLLAVVGPSGSGKDSIMNWLRENCDGEALMFARRTVTRPASLSHEDHDGVSEQRFAELSAKGDFAVTWQAHGLSYGLPRDCLTTVKRGNLVIANGSRRALPEICEAFPKVAVASISVQPDVLAERLRSRGRETEEQITARLTRPPIPVPDGLPVFDIDNSTNIAEAGRQLKAAVSALLDLQKSGNAP